MLSSHQSGSLVSCTEQGIWNQKVLVKNPHIVAIGPLARLLGLLTLIVLFNGQGASNTWLLEVLVQVKGKCCKALHQLECLWQWCFYYCMSVTHSVGQSFAEFCTTPEGPLGCPSAKLF